MKEYAKITKDGNCSECGKYIFTVTKKCVYCGRTLLTNALIEKLYKRIEILAEENRYYQNMFVFYGLAGKIDGSHNSPEIGTKEK